MALDTTEAEIDVSALYPNNPSLNADEDSLASMLDGQPIPKRKLVKRTTDGSQVASDPLRRISTPSMSNVNRDNKVDAEERRRKWEKFKLNFLYFEWMVGNSYMRQIFRVISAINIIALLFNSIPPFIDRDTHSWTIYYSILLSVDSLLAISFTIHLVARTVNSWYWYRHSLKPITWTSDHHVIRHVILLIITGALWYSVSIETYRMACLQQCASLSSLMSDEQSPFTCNTTSGIICPPHSLAYLLFIPRLLSIFSASRFLYIFKQLRVPSSVIRELGRYYLVKHLLNVFIFYLLVVFIYSLIGVNIIGPLSHRCVRESVLQANNWTKNENNCYLVNESSMLRQLEQALSAPDFHCRQVNSSSSCPSDLTCQCVEIERNLEFQADYPDIGHGIFSVYESSTFELWTRTLYDAIDGENSVEALLFFFTMVFFLVILVQESIFLVVIIESFASVRSESYIARTKSDRGPNQVLEEQDGKLRLVHTEGWTETHWKTKYSKQWMWFQKAMLILVLLDAIVMATRSYHSDEQQIYSCYLFIVSLWQLVVSIVFLMEVFCNLVYHWWRPFFSSLFHWYLLIIAVGSLASAVFEIAYAAAAESPGATCVSVGVSVPPVTPLILFQSLRIIRLVWLAMPLTEFTKQVIGKDTKISVTFVAVLSFILVFAAINVQLFAFIEPERELFSNILVGYQSQFQLLFQEGWIELLSELMFDIDVWWLINIWIIILYFVASLILLNFFTAIILDNLDLDEETKVERLKEALAQDSHKEETVPVLWKLSTRIGGGPDTVSIAQQPGFDGPQIRASVMKDFLERGEIKRNEDHPSSPNLLTPPPQTDYDSDAENGMPRLIVREPHLHLLSMPNTARQRRAWGRRERQESINDIIYKLKVIRSTRRFDPVDSRGEGRSARKVLRVKLSEKSHSSRKYITSRTAIDQLRRDHRCFDRALFCLTPNNWLRKLCHKILTQQLQEPLPNTGSSSSRLGLIFNKVKFYFLLLVSILPYFQWFMGLILAGLITLQFLEDMYPPATSCKAYKITSDSLFVFFTLCELLLKILANGLVINPYAAISSIHDLMDWVIVIATTIRIGVVASDLVDNYNPWGYPAYAVLLVFWSLRPFRIVSLLPPVREILSDLWSGRKKFLFALILFSGFVFGFASLGTQLFSGDLGKCNDPNINDKGCCIGEFQSFVHLSFDTMFQDPVTNITVPRVWIERPRDFQFNTIGESFATLWSLLPLEGWLVLRDYLDLKAELHGGFDNWLNLIELKIFLHIYIFIGANIGLALFVGVIVANYNENRSDHAALLTVGQKQWQDLQQRISLTTPKKIPPIPSYSSRVRYYVYIFVNDSLYEWFHSLRRVNVLRHFRPFRELELMAILFNAFTLSVRWDGSDGVKAAVALSIVFHLWFIVETVLKLIAFSKSYFHSARNVFELMLSICSFGYIIFAVVTLAIDVEGNCEKELYKRLSDVALSLAVMRCITLLGKYEVMASIVQTIIIAIINTIPLMVLMAIIMVAYANIGTALFGQVTKGEGIDMRHVNFRFHNNSLYLGIRMLTGEDWYQLMWDTGVSPPYCSPDGINCGSPYVSVIYFLSFFFLTIFVFLNLFRAVLLEAFSVFYNEDDTALDHKFLKTFRKNWSKFDSTAKGFITLSKVKFLIRSFGLTRYFRYRVDEAGVKERVEVDIQSDALVLREVYRELELGINVDQGRSDEEYREEMDQEHHQVSFSSVLRTVAFKAEDISRRLTPNELKERITLEQSIQNDVATRCIHLWMKKYVKEVLDNFQPEDDQDDLPVNEDGVPMVIPQIIEHQASLPTDTTEDEGEYPSRPQVLPILPVPQQKMEVKAKKPGTTAPMVPKLTVDPPTHEVDPNHIWFEEQMMFDSDDDALIL